MSEVTRNEYEVVVVARPTLGEDGLTALNDRVAQVVAGQGGEVTGTELWGKRTLAYPIKKLFEGVYVLHRVALPPQGTAEVDRFLRFNEDVIRYLVVRTDE
jgi:small subunit ribosomal protein S6